MVKIFSRAQKNPHQYCADNYQYCASPAQKINILRQKNPVNILQDKRLSKEYPLVHLIRHKNQNMEV